jgi:hypothetical protein
MPGEKGEKECSYIFTKTNAGVCLSSLDARSTRKSTATRKSLSKFLENEVSGNVLVLLPSGRGSYLKPDFAGTAEGYAGRGDGSVRKG